jgi:predicted nucleic acid-binding protein
MADELVVDASVAAKLYFIEANSALAEAALRAADRLIAPELLFIEMASIAAKYARRGLATADWAAGAVTSVGSLLDEAVPLTGLAPRAYALAEAHGFSAYDGAYLALAEARGMRLITADAKLCQRAVDARLSHLVRPLTP